MSHRHRITIERRVERRNTVGEVTHEYEQPREIWAQIADNTITIRYMAEIYPGDRVVIAKSYFEIQAVIDRKFRRGRLVELRVKEQTERGRPHFPRFSGAQQSFRASAESVTNSSDRDLSNELQREVTDRTETIPR